MGTRTQACSGPKPLLLLPTWLLSSQRLTNTLFMSQPTQAPRGKGRTREGMGRGRDRQPARVSLCTQGLLPAKPVGKAPGTSRIVKEARSSLPGGEAGICLPGMFAAGADLIWAHLSRVGERQRGLAGWEG